MVDRQDRRLPRGSIERRSLETLFKRSVARDDDRSTGRIVLPQEAARQDRHPARVDAYMIATGGHLPEFWKPETYEGGRGPRAREAWAWKSQGEEFDILTLLEQRAGK